MVNRLDEIFSPERLRARWQGRTATEAKQDEPSATSPEAQTVTAVYSRLQSLIQERYPGEQGAALNVMMGELQELLGKRFPQSEETEVSEDEKATLNSSIEEILNTVEDLLEALEL